MQVIAATNIAETSVTLEGIVYVIDSCFAKQVCPLCCFFSRGFKMPTCLLASPYTPHVWCSDKQHAAGVLLQLLL